MSRQIEQALLSLMPAHGSDLPSSLVELASSLLAQSRHRASTLKAEEEVARQYACANIACDRLKITLNLPPIEPRPPVPPRIYKRLYTHLDNILPNPSSTPRSGRVRTPSSKKSGHDTPAESQTRALPSRGTPTKDTSLAQFRTPTKTRAGSASRPKEMQPQSSRDRVYPWIQPVVRYMCAESGHKKLAPTVLAGMEHILNPNGRPTQNEWVIQHVSDLVAATYFFVTMRVRAIMTGADIDREGYVPMRKEILALLLQGSQEVTVPDVGESEAWEGWKEVKSREFDAAVAKVNESDWLTGDWYQGIVDVIDSKTKADAVMSDSAQEAFEASLPTRRADAMLQERYNFLSESKKADYATWREAMLAKIAQAVPVESSMEVDTQ
ncbi:hypothetical protein QQS21_008940 [Conoideocrella luteorostrata]|uniref:ORC6 first cyclin-like domain-containing protein n=1 Tax=Conoideocrella luteorostrata TaxID=1105319 RepID=A0AAJ0CI61_9HYPO|nr:hypothetical protein QQS21_008940 [Conoideocrella luteorostrata]